jgi:hypothetical protein
MVFTDDSLSEVTPDPNGLDSDGLWSDDEQERKDGENEPDEDEEEEKEEQEENIEENAHDQEDGRNRDEQETAVKQAVAEVCKDMRFSGSWRSLGPDGWYTAAPKDYEARKMISREAEKVSKRSFEPAAQTLPVLVVGELTNEDAKKFKKNPCPVQLDGQNQVMIRPKASNYQEYRRKKADRNAAILKARQDKMRDVMVNFFWKPRVRLSVFVKTESFEVNTVLVPSSGASGYHVMEQIYAKKALGTQCYEFETPDEEEEFNREHRRLLQEDQDRRMREEYCASFLKAIGLVDESRLGQYWPKGKSILKYDRNSALSRAVMGAHVFLESRKKALREKAVRQARREEALRALREARKRKKARRKAPSSTIIMSQGAEPARRKSDARRGGLGREQMVHAADDEEREAQLTEKGKKLDRIFRGLSSGESEHEEQDEKHLRTGQDGEEAEDQAKNSSSDDSSSSSDDSSSSVNENKSKQEYTSSSSDDSISFVKKNDDDTSPSLDDSNSSSKDGFDNSNSDSQAGSEEEGQDSNNEQQYESDDCVDEERKKEGQKRNVNSSNIDEQVREEDEKADNKPNGDRTPAATDLAAECIAECGPDCMCESCYEKIVQAIRKEEAKSDGESDDGAADNKTDAADNQNNNENDDTEATKSKATVVSIERPENIEEAHGRYNPRTLDFSAGATASNTGNAARSGILRKPTILPTQTNPSTQTRSKRTVRSTPQVDGMQQEENNKRRHVLQQGGKFSFSGGRGLFFSSSNEPTDATAQKPAPKRKASANTTTQEPAAKKPKKKSPNKKPPVNPQTDKTAPKVAPKKKTSNTTDTKASKSAPKKKAANNNMVVDPPAPANDIANDVSAVAIPESNQAGYDFFKPSRNCSSSNWDHMRLLAKTKKPYNPKRGWQSRDSKEWHCFLCGIKGQFIPGNTTLMTRHYNSDMHQKKLKCLANAQS